MAIYHSTIRSDTKIIDGIEIGRYQHAYKESWSSNNFPGGSGRRVSAAEYHAHNAAYKNRKIRHFVFADSFAEACEDGYYVFQIDRDPPLSTSGTITGSVIVGVIRKEGGRFVFRRTETRMAA